MEQTCGIQLVIDQSGANGKSSWPRVWREPEPKRRYDTLIGGGGHGLATAFYLASRYGTPTLPCLKRAGLGQEISGVTPQLLIQLSTRWKPAFL